MPSMLVMEADAEEGHLTLVGASYQGTDEFMDGTCKDVSDLDWAISAMPAEGEEVEADIVPLDVDGADDAAAIEPPPPKPAEESDVFNLREKLYANSKLHCLTHTPFKKFCQGCMAKARDKPHYKGSFDKKGR